MKKGTETTLYYFTLCINFHHLTVEQHAIVRPIYDKILKQGGNWNDKQIIDDASEFLDEIIKKGNSLKINEDLFIWSSMLNHKVMLDMELTYEEAKEFYEMITQSVKIMVLPETLLNCKCIGNQMKLPETRNHRKNMIEKYKVILKRQYKEISIDISVKPGVIFIESV